VDFLNQTLTQVGSVIIIFLILTVISEVIYKIVKNNYINYIDMKEYLPEDEVHSLRQVFYLILMALCIANVFYYLIGEGIEFIKYYPIYDILLSLYFTIKLDKSTTKNKVLWLLLIPYASLLYVLFNITLINYLNIIHILVFIYLAKLCFDKFMEYTESNGLGITIVLLFVIIFSSFFITQHAEGVNALDSLVMISNQFTGNGFGVFGNSIAGKLNSLLLVWGGYVISGASAATLTAAILVKHFRKRIEEIEKLIEGDDE
jgi:hypothetical protein